MDRARVEQVATLTTVRPADRIPVLDGQDHGLVVVVPSGDDDQLVAVQVAVALQVMGRVPQQVVRGEPISSVRNSQALARHSASDRVVRTRLPCAPVPLPVPVPVLTPALFCEMESVCTIMALSPSVVPGHDRAPHH